MPIWDERSDEEYRASQLKLMTVRKFRLDSAFESLGTLHNWSVAESFEQSNVKVKIKAKDDFVIIESSAEILRSQIQKPRSIESVQSDQNLNCVIDQNYLMGGKYPKIDVP